MHRVHSIPRFSGGIPRPARQRGISLIEILAVLVILTILAALLLPSFRWIRMRAGVTHEINALKNIGAATALYASDNNGTLPPATPFGQHLTHRVLPLRIMLEQGYLGPRDLRSPLARKWDDPIASNGWQCVGTHRTTGVPVIQAKSAMMGNPNYTDVALVAFESWAAPQYHARPPTPWAGQTDTPDYPVPPPHKLGMPYQWPNQPPLPPSRMKMVWNFEYDIAAGQAAGVQYWRKGPGACLFGDGHVEVTGSKDQASWFQYMQTR